MDPLQLFLYFLVKITQKPIIFCHLWGMGGEGLFFVNLYMYVNI